MAQRPHVPNFGNCESEENVPYTAYFDKARKGKVGGKLINPNDPQENPSAFGGAPPVRGPPFRTASDPEGPPPQPAAVEKPNHEPRKSKDDNEYRRPIESPARPDAVPRRAFAESPFHGAGEKQGDSLSHRKGRTGGGPERNYDQSPLHARAGSTASKGGMLPSSPSWERRNATDNAADFAPSTPNRRLRNVDAPERGPAVPKFGDWDESNPASADGYTHIFNKVREEKQLGTAKIPAMATESAYSTGPRQPKSQNSGSMWGCCFGK